MNLAEKLLSQPLNLSPSVENNLSPEEIQALADKVNELRKQLVNPEFQATLQDGAVIVAYFRARRGAAFSIKEEKPVKTKKVAGGTPPAKPRKTTTKEAQQKLSESILANL